MLIPWEMITGGLTGLIGTIFNAINQRKIKELDLKETEMENAHELAMIKAQSEAVIEEAKARISITEATIEGEIQKQDAEGFQTSLVIGNKDVFEKEYMEKLFKMEGWLRYITVPLGAFLCILFGFVDVLRSLMRPVLTGYSVGVVTWLAMEGLKILSETDTKVSITDAVQLYKTVQDIALFLASMSFTWWFGDRMTDKSYASIRGKYDDIKK
jgi:hypothetical protein